MKLFSYQRKRLLFFSTLICFVLITSLLSGCRLSKEEQLETDQSAAGTSVTSFPENAPQTDPPPAPPINSAPTGTSILPLTNSLSGISIAFSGDNGGQWAVERNYHDEDLTDQVVYLRSDADIYLYHNEFNTLVSIYVDDRFIGADGLDGVANSGDEGIIKWKIDRDLQSHPYDDTPDYVQDYTEPFRLEDQTYDGTLAVMGALGDNGGPWGSMPGTTTERFAYGQRDEFGNECHSLAYWDEDTAVIQNMGVDPGKLNTSDGHTLLLCVNPVTPVIQFKAQPEGEFYTTPIKTYHVPKLWSRRTYLNQNVEISFVNLSNTEGIHFRIDQGEFQLFDGTPLVSGALFSENNSEHILTVKNGLNGVEYTRAITFRPMHPAPEEEHGNLLWANEAGRQAVIEKITNVSPFVESENIFDNSWYQGLPFEPTKARAAWRYHATMANHTLNNSFIVAMEGAANRLEIAQAAKERLLKIHVYQPVGFEVSVQLTSPAKDFLNELSQTLELFTDLGVGYDIMAAHFLDTDHPQGITPIEHFWIRDGLAKIAKSILQFRGNYEASSGGGNTHWAHGYEFAITGLAMAMPTYKTPYYGVSGADLVTTNDLVDAEGKYWNPFPDQNVTWYQAANDHTIETPGHPNVRYPHRSEFLLTDDGYWTGANGHEANGERYFDGFFRNQTVGTNYGGMANVDLDAAVELVEMAGYEQPYTMRTIVVDHMRRLKGDIPQSPAMPNYIRRLVVTGEVPLFWDEDSWLYTAQTRRIQRVVHAFNDRYNFASLPTPKARVEELINNLTLYYNEPSALPDEIYNEIKQYDRKIFYNAYALALCADPLTMPDPTPEANHPPTMKPIYKHIVSPGDPIYKEVIAADTDDEAVTVQVANLPDFAQYDPGARRITGVPEVGDLGVHIVTITASDGNLSVSRPFPIIVKNVEGPNVVEPPVVNASYSAETNSVTLDWAAPPDQSVDHYVIYRDGALLAIVPGTQTTFENFEILPATHSRYQVAAYAPNGAESGATQTTPKIISIP